MVFIWNNNSLPKTKKMRKTITFKNKSTSTIQPTQLPLNSIDRRSRNTLNHYFCFTVSFRSNDLIHLQKYSKRQECLHTLIKYLHDEKGMGYRKISNFLNRSGIKTHRGNTFTNSSIHSILKRKKQRDERMVLRNKEYPIKMSKLELKYIRT